MSSQAAPLEIPPERLIFERIAVMGPVTFWKYMMWCLYDPTCGYYSKPESARHADYYTNVDVNPIFGRLLARQLEEMWRVLGRRSRFRVVECGAGVGRLASHILDFAERELPEFYDALHYVAVEVTAARRANHEIILQRHIARDHAESSEDLPERTLVGCIFSNEMFDAFPVHRVICRGGELQEIYVGIVDGKLAEVIRPFSTPATAEYFKRQGIMLREGQITEACLEACQWIAEMGTSLGRGFVMTVDYGYQARELYSESRMRGTLLAYKDHKVNENYYDSPGEQDLTAHANFTALELWGRDAGLEPLGLVPQSRFLVSLGKGNEFADLYDPGQTETERVRAQLGLSQLLNPEGMGETFQVFIQQKGIPGAKLTGLQPL